MKWNKLGMIFNLKEHNIPWIKSHAMLPTPILYEDKLRMFFTARNHQGQSCLSFVDVDPNDPRKILYVHQTPVFEKGQIGLFDDCGVLGTCVVKHGSDLRLYFNGYNVRNTVPMSNAIGVAISHDGGRSFKKMYDGAIVDRNNHEPYFAISAWVSLQEGKLRLPPYRSRRPRWNMWYASGTGWVKVKDKQEPLYEIKYASSEDGLVWQRDNITCIHPLTELEANARSTVIYEKDLFRMWYCYRGSYDFRDGKDSYQIGYAESKDGVSWIRKDEQVGIQKGLEGEWDATMVTYPAVIVVGDKKYLFYNGNGFGSAGFGCAVLEE